MDYIMAGYFKQSYVAVKQGNRIWKFLSPFTPKIVKVFLD